MSVIPGLYGCELHMTQVGMDYVLIEVSVLQDQQEGPTTARNMD